MRVAHHNRLVSVMHRFFADRPKELPADWCCRELRFDEPNNTGPFTLTGREYMRQPLNDWADPLVTDIDMVFGTQTGKSGGIMGGAAWTVANEPSRFLWVMPTRDLVRGFSRTRWMPMIRASHALGQHIPTGTRRFEFATHQQCLAGSIIDFAWSNSPSALSSNPCRVVILDEVDKFPHEHKREANAMALAGERTKSFALPKRVKTSTPTLTDGLIWQDLLATQLHRRFLPCPHCGRHHPSSKRMVLVWSKRFTVFKLTGAEGVVVWDKEARRKDGSWDLDRVERSARVVCPFNGCHILDADKTRMDREGVWQPTQEGARGMNGYHLPSLYAAHVETSFGRLAVKFLKAKMGLSGLQNFINSDLAEPMENQDTRSERVEIITDRDTPPLKEAVPILTADYQLTSPHLWFIARAWKGHSRLLDYGPLDTFEELRGKQLEHHVADNHVGIDSGHAAEEVYAACLRYGRLHRRHNAIPLWLGWTPMKGLDRLSPWKDPETKQPVPFALGAATLPHRQFRLPLLEFMPDLIKDILERLRTGKTSHRWELFDRVDEEYFRHLDSEVKRAEWDRRRRRVVSKWRERSRTWPAHLRDAEIMNTVMALFHQLLPMVLEESAK